MGALRKVSRQEYPKKREQKKLEEMRERRELRYMEEIYEIVKKPSDNISEYGMPEAYDHKGGVNQEKRFAVALQRYRDSTAGDKMNPQEAWEDHQIGKATSKFNAKNKLQRCDDYQFVFQDQIKFIKSSVMEGVNTELAESPDESKAKSAVEKLQEERKALPIYPYHDELLQAILMIVWFGEDHTDPPVCS
ncbi:hypothetical protein CFOL_v3_34438 [Cephalotus follicularis]|uniref:Uncharacterized protein n=1 Tax=Cephalotus follicularis TaxID=3775 RepID=A0A1Q3DFK9_CEPFO|nr:hypothetical protein CFOL_v3_34438 [Cephalotus follicularis]